MNSIKYTSKSKLVKSVLNQIVVVLCPHTHIPHHVVHEEFEVLDLHLRLVVLPVLPEQDDELLDLPDLAEPLQVAQQVLFHHLHLYPEVEVLKGLLVLLYLLVLAVQGFYSLFLS